MTARIRTARTGQAQLYSQNRTGRLGQADQDRQRDRQKGQAEQERHNRTSRTGQAVQDEQNRTDTELDRQNWTVNRAARIRQPGQDTQKRTERRGQPNR
jgi:hypothetical protein